VVGPIYCCDMHWAWFNLNAKSNISIYVALWHALSLVQPKCQIQYPYMYEYESNSKIYNSNNQELIILYAHYKWRMNISCDMRVNLNLHLWLSRREILFLQKIKYKSEIKTIKEIWRKINGENLISYKWDLTPKNHPTINLLIQSKFLL
jgi:hypothetical protein